MKDFIYRIKVAYWYWKLARVSPLIGWSISASHAEPEAREWADTARESVENELSYWTD